MWSQNKKRATNHQCITVNSNSTAFESNFLQILALLGAQTPGFSFNFTQLLSAMLK